MKKNQAKPPEDMKTSLSTDFQIKWMAELVLKTLEFAESLKAAAHRMKRNKALKEPKTGHKG